MSLCLLDIWEWAFRLFPITENAHNKIFENCFSFVLILVQLTWVAEENRMHNRSVSLVWRTYRYAGWMEEVP